MSSSQTLEAQWLAHQRRYKELNRSFQRSCDSIPKLSDLSEREDAVQCAKQKMHEIEDLLQGMKSDLRSLPTQHKISKAVFTAEWHKYSEQYCQIKREYRRCASKHNFLSMEPHSQYERLRLLNNEGIMQNIKLKSQQSLKLLSESESIGLNVCDNLNAQGKQLDKINIDVKEINDISERAHRMLKTLKTKIYTDRLLQLLIVCSELAIIVFLLWWKLRKDV
eukprot:27373_1